MRVPLIQGAYTALSVIADAQRAVNLYPEKNPPDSLSPFTHYNAPGLIALGTAPNAPARGLYRANNDSLYYVAGNTLYYVDSGWRLNILGTIGTTNGIVSMADNGTTMVLVDGSSNGYQVALANNAFSPISSTTNAPPPIGGGVYAFYGATRVDMIDGFMLFNQPGTQNYYSTYDNEIVFDATWFAAKNGFSDLLATLIVSRRQIWLIGEKTAEIWFDAGGTTFPFQIMPGPFTQHGTNAPQSVAQINGTIFWLAQDQAGQNLVLRGEGYVARRISTHALEAEWVTYPTTADAESFCFQIEGHAIYQINFPTADKSWRWDENSELWHQVAWTDTNGVDHRHRAAVAAFAYNTNVVADWQTGQLYNLSLEAFDDAGTPMVFRRGYPHIMKDGRRVIYPGFVLDIQAATSRNTVVASPPKVLMRFSDDRGVTWSNPISKSLGATGQYLAQPKWWRNGMGRDRVFEVFGVVPGRIAINGAFLDPEPIPLAS